MTGTFQGTFTTSSFYRPHHMTTGKGGAVYTSDEELDTIIASFHETGDVTVTAARARTTRAGCDSSSNFRNSPLATTTNTFTHTLVTTSR